jgi:hypothetical protein
LISQQTFAANKSDAGLLLTIAHSWKQSPLGTLLPAVIADLTLLVTLTQASASSSASSTTAEKEKEKPGMAPASLVASWLQNTTGLLKELSKVYEVLDGKIPKEFDEEDEDDSTDASKPSDKVGGSSNGMYFSTQSASWNRDKTDSQITIEDDLIKRTPDGYSTTLMACTNEELPLSSVGSMVECCVELMANPHTQGL